MMEGQDIGLDILICTLTIVALANYRLRRSVLYPPFLFCGMWLLDAVVFRLHLVDVNPIHPITLCVIAAGAILFSLGGLCAFLVPETMIATRLTLIGKPKMTGNWMRYLVVLFLAVCVCFAIHAMIVVAAGAGGVGGLFFAVARETVIENINEGHESIPWYSYAATWTIFAATLFQCRAKRSSFLDRRGHCLCQLCSKRRPRRISLSLFFVDLRLSCKNKAREICSRNAIRALAHRWLLPSFRRSAFCG